MNASKLLPQMPALCWTICRMQCHKLCSVKLLNTSLNSVNPVFCTFSIKSNVNRLFHTVALKRNSDRFLNSARLKGTSDVNEKLINKEQADDLVLRLTENERTNLLTALQEFEASKIKAEYEGQLAATRWRSRFGRPSKLPRLGDVDPTGTYCQLSDDWLKKKYAKIKYTPIQKSWEQRMFDTENVPPPTLNQLLNVGVHNAVPFIGFGFLDNFIMIIAGDYIEISLGAFITISTMAAAALGNTISDVMGIGSAWYVEQLASKIGLKPPNLSPIQLDMPSARSFANLGRAIGITVGCLLGMLPLLFISSSEEEKETTNKPEVVQNQNPPS